MLWKYNWSSMTGPGHQLMEWYHYDLVNTALDNNIAVKLGCIK
jgi:hypothetical protein